MKKLLFYILLMCCFIDVAAQGVDDVTLVVSATGTTKEEAVTSALRSAIEQAYGVFVSANTTILNDELVKDEIATVASGNVKSYTELESAALPNGTFLVSLQAVVSTQNLVLYANSKGSSCEFAGGTTILANQKLKELNIKNAEKALENLLVQLREIAPYMFEHKLTMTHVHTNEFRLYIGVYSNSNTETFVNLIHKTLQAIKVSEEEEMEYNRYLGWDWKPFKTLVNSYWQTYLVDCDDAFEEIMYIVDMALNNFIIESSLGEVYSLVNPHKHHRDGLNGFWAEGGAQVFRNAYRNSYMGWQIPYFKRTIEGPIFNFKKKKQPTKWVHVPTLMYLATQPVSVPVEDLDKVISFELKPKYDVSAQFSFEEDLAKYASSRLISLPGSNGDFDFGIVINAGKAYWYTVGGRPACPNYHISKYVENDSFDCIKTPKDFLERIIEFNGTDSEWRSRVEKYIYNYFEELDKYNPKDAWGPIRVYVPKEKRCSGVWRESCFEIDGKQLKLNLYDFEWSVKYADTYDGPRISLPSVMGDNHKWLKW